MINELPPFGIHNEVCSHLASVHWCFPLNKFHVLLNLFSHMHPNHLRSLKRYLVMSSFHSGFLRGLVRVGWMEEAITDVPAAYVYVISFILSPTHSNALTTSHSFQCLDNASSV